MKDINKENQVLETFWDNAFKEYQPCVATEDDLGITGNLEEELLFINDSCKKIIDIGCGDGLMLMKMAFHNQGNTYLGIDSSSSGVAFAFKTSKLSKLEHLTFEVGNLETIKKITTYSYDGIISSNFLDVIPLDTAKLFISEIIRILDKTGYLLLKVNFIIDKPETIKPGFVFNDDGVFIDGVLRSTNKDDEFWINSFKPLRLIKKDYYKRNPKGPKDRIFVFKKD